MPSDPFTVDLKAIGGSIPTEMAEHLSLIVACYGTSRSQILLDLVEDYLKQSASIPKLIAKIAKKAMLSWDGSRDIFDYLQSVREILLRKKVTQPHIEKIINEMKRLYGTDKRHW